jgi:ArsR family transcriptional regulator, lead/cadmium/zinc/bismuth-responsive transcriptional repressor
MEQENIVDIVKVNKIKKIMPSDDLLFDIAEVFKVFGDTTRMKIISALLESELCVGDIAEITNSTQSAISHQLRVLKQAKLVKFRKEGKAAYYSLDDDHIKDLYEIAKKHIEEEYEHR